MRKFIKGLWRFVQPIRVYKLKYFFSIWKLYYKFLLDRRTYIKAGGEARFEYIAPYLSFKNEDSQTGGGHYFYQDIWALRKLVKLKPMVHVDIGSRYDGFVGQATAITYIISVDIRKPSFSLPNFEYRQGDITVLPFQSDTVESISCLHTIEHIGLGRYGDLLDPHGVEKSLLELQRVIKESGNLIVSFPIGVSRTEFNAQRIIDPIYPLKILNKMELIEFSVVNDEGKFEEDTNPEKYLNGKYCCGLYHFVKK